MPSTETPLILQPSQSAAKVPGRFCFNRVEQKRNAGSISGFVRFTQVTLYVPLSASQKKLPGNSVRDYCWDCKTITRTQRLLVASNLGIKKIIFDHRTWKAISQHRTTWEMLEILPSFDQLIPYPSSPLSSGAWHNLLAKETGLWRESCSTEPWFFAEMVRCIWPLSPLNNYSGARGQAIYWIYFRSTQRFGIFPYIPPATSPKTHRIQQDHNPTRLVFAAFQLCKLIPWGCWGQLSN